jgi:hypothetical protein
MSIAGRQPTKSNVSIAAVPMKDHIVLPVSDTVTRITNENKTDRITLSK